MSRLCQFGIFADGLATGLILGLFGAAFLVSCLMGADDVKQPTGAHPVPAAKKLERADRDLTAPGACCTKRRRRFHFVELFGAQGKEKP
jgi:hypothetical protein